MTVTIELAGCATGRLLDRLTKRIGLRTLRLDRHADEWGESFQFVVNGVPFFAKGANWIPADTFAPRVTRDDYARLLRDTADANMNMLRVWGGGIYEDDVFYDLCDELGITVWQDFMFACSTYPAFDDAFLANVRAEAEDNVRRLRHHPCLALWCGNNELEQGLVGEEWIDGTDELGGLFPPVRPACCPRWCATLDPERDYWPCSPHSPHGDRDDHSNPQWGDAHLWDVWHGKKPFEWYRTCEHRFASEFGFQSFPEPKTVYAYTAPADRNITSYVMEHHQRSGIGNTTIISYMLDWFRLPTNFDMTLWLSQILHGMAMKYAVENWRRHHAAHHGHALLAAQRLLAGGELGLHRLPRPLESLPVSGEALLRPAAGLRGGRRADRHRRTARHQRPARAARRRTRLDAHRCRRQHAGRRRRDGGDRPAHQHAGRRRSNCRPIWTPTARATCCSGWS